MRKNIFVFALIALAMLVGADSAFAETAASSGAYLRPIGIGMLMAVAVLGGALGQAKAISSGLEAIGRNPSARGDIQGPMILGLVFIESLVIFALAISFVGF